MDEPLYQYRVVINGIPSAAFFKEGWTEINKATVRLMELREVNPRATLMMEISPWYTLIGEIPQTIYCPGCDYGDCPVGSK